MPDTKKCPYCAEDIRFEAIRCPHCRSRLNTFDTSAWHRDHDEAKLAGVAAALSHALALPVSLVRVGFVVLSFLHLLGPILYAILWLVIPPKRGQDSLAEDLMTQCLAFLRRMSTPHAPASGGRPRSDRDTHLPVTHPRANGAATDELTDERNG